MADLWPVSVHGLLRSRLLDAVPIVANRSHGASIRTVDPATLALNCATALTAALTLLFSRLDSRRQHSEEQFNLQRALEDLYWAVGTWTTNAEYTNYAMLDWAQGNLGIDEAAKHIRDTLRAQESAATNVFLMLYGEDNESQRQYHKPQRLPLRHLLTLYGPEVLDVLKTGAAGRAELLDELIAELPHLQAKPEYLQATLTRLESTWQELNHALEQLKEYIREHYPVRRARYEE